MRQPLILRPLNSMGWVGRNKAIMSEEERMLAVLSAKSLKSDSQVRAFRLRVPLGPPAARPPACLPACLP